MTVLVCGHDWAVKRDREFVTKVIQHAGQLIFVHVTPRFHGEIDNILRIK